MFCEEQFEWDYVVVSVNVWRCAGAGGEAREEENTIAEKFVPFPQDNDNPLFSPEWWSWEVFEDDRSNGT